MIALAPPEVSPEISVSELVERAREDLLFFSNFFLPRRLPFEAQIHKDIAAFLEAGHDNTLLVGPPDSRKSTLWRDFIVRELLKNPNLIVLVIRENSKRAAETHAEIRRCFDEPRIVRYFGQRVHPDYDTLDGFSMRDRTQWDDQPNFACIGWKEAIQGRHAHIILIDDGATDTNQTSIVQRGRWINRLLKIISRRTKRPGKGLHIVNNRICHDDATMQLEATYFRSATLVISAEDENGRSTWPEQWPDEPGARDEAGQLLLTLSQLREQLTEPVYELMYLCRATVEGDESIPLWAYQYYEEADLPKDLVIRYGLDPGGTGRVKSERTASFGIVWGGHTRGENWRYYVMDAVARTGSARDSKNVVVGFVRALPGVVALDVNNLGGDVWDMLRTEPDLHIPLKRIQFANDHPYRVGVLRSLMEAGRIAFPAVGRQSNGVRLLLKQLKAAPYAHTARDLVDALYYAVEAVVTPNRSAARRGRVWGEPIARLGGEQRLEQDPNEPDSRRRRSPVYWEDGQGFDRLVALGDPAHWAEIAARSPYA